MKIKWNKDKDSLIMKTSIPIQSESFLKEQEELMKSIVETDYPKFKSTDDLLEEFLKKNGRKFL